MLVMYWNRFFLRININNFPGVKGANMVISNKKNTPLKE